LLEDVVGKTAMGMHGTFFFLFFQGVNNWAIHCFSCHKNRFSGVISTARYSNGDLSERLEKSGKFVDKVLQPFSGFEVYDDTSHDHYHTASHKIKGGGGFNTR